MVTSPALVYLLCMVTSLICLALTARGYRRTGTQLVFWTAICFVFLAINNLLLFLDLVILPEFDLRPYRTAAMVAAQGVLLFGLISRSE